MSKTLLAVLALLFYLVLIAGLAYVFALRGTPLILYLVLLGGLGIGVFFFLLWFWSRRGSQNGTPANPQDANNLDLLLREAERKLAQSQKSSSKKLNALPLVYIIGESNSAKTTSIIQSGLNPDLLAGQIYRDQDIAPTGLINVWYSSGAAFVEAGDNVLKQTGLWQRLIQRTMPSRFRASLAGKVPARCVVVCFSLERFLSANSIEAIIPSARFLNERLRILSQALGIALPVFVIFTKLDRVAHFAEYARNLSQEESNRILGAALSGTQTSAGLYAEGATQAISASFDEITYELSEFRLELLSRENDSAQLDGIYEFTRELRKLRNPLTQFLVELGRPSQLGLNPYLRGFFFTGVRAQIVEEAMTAAAASRSAPVESGATRMFALHQTPAAPAVQQRVVNTRKVAHWAFLTHVFPSLILKDRTALESSRRSTKASALRRVFLTAVCVLLLLFLALMTLSYVNNRRLADRIQRAADALSGRAASTTEIASLSDLQAMDNLRSALVVLNTYQEYGVPWSYRWGLYEGDDLAARGKQVYFDHFRRLFLDQIQTRWVTALNAVPSTPAQGADYSATYNPLRAYLITTSHNEKSTVDFLTPVMLQNWVNGRGVSPDIQQLGQKQIEFYADELRARNPYSIHPDDTAVARARVYLSKFGGSERIYQNMLAAASRSNPPVDFNHDHPGAAETVSDSHIVPGAFSKKGFAQMEDAIRHPDRFFSGEAWVLGDQPIAALDTANLTSQLQMRYTADFLAQWRAFLHSANVVHYRGLPDAATKLSTLAGTTSPLLALFSTVSQNTAVDSPAIAQAFQPAQVLVPPQSSDRLIGPGNKSYVDALLALQGAVSQVAQTQSTGPVDPNASAPITNAATLAHTAAQQTAQAFRIDPDAHIESVSLKLLQDPITSTEGLVKGLGPAAVNGGARGFCSAFNLLSGKYPFSPSSALQATPDEVRVVLQPGSGTLWQFYDQTLKPLLIPMGSQYAPSTTAAVHLTPAFITFFNHAAALSNVLFPAGAQSPQFNFSMREEQTKGITGATLSIDGQEITSTSESKQVSWIAANARQVSLTASYMGSRDVPLLQFRGTWAIFQFIDKGHGVWSPGGGHLEYPLETSGTPILLPDGTPLVVKFDVGIAPPVFDPAFRAGLHCPSEAAR
jgi:type VI secretion system protein ImpL